MLFVIEGLDGAGKSTQVEKIKDYLISVYGEIDYIHFPRYDAPVYGELIGKFLRGDFGDIDKVHPLLVALLYAEDRHEAAPMMRRSLDAGRCLLLDRYVYSNIAYQCAKVPADKREELRRWILDTEFGVFGLPKPDLNIFLDVPLAFVREKLSAERCGKDREYLEGNRDIHEKSIAFQSEVRSVYASQAALDPGFMTVDCSGPGGRMLGPDDIFRKIKHEIDRIINL